jgi:flagellar biosynthesis protein FlhA
MADITNNGAGIGGALSNAFIKQRSDAMVAVGVIAAVLMLILPLPTILLDVFQAVNLVLAILIILMVLSTKRAVDFNVFPTLLLVTTVLSLALNVSSTRAILGMGAQFDGHMIRAFSTFVVGSGGVEGLVIGSIIFIIIIAVQVMVITKGATRVAEVAARFTLDALPGKQMAIDQEFSSGLISEAEAQKKKRDLQNEVDFYGAMDGASKFVSGNVTVGIFITLINVIGGFIIGVTLHGESLAEAVNTYISLSIGDGLITQMPELLISVATGLIVTRSVSDGTLGEDVSKQFSRQGRAYFIAAGFVLLLGFIPNFPWYVLIPMAAGLAYLGYRMNAKEVAEKAAAEGAPGRAAEAPAAAKKGEQAELSPVVPLDPISIELGFGLIPLVDKDQGAELLDRITKIRRESALDMGLVVPRIRIIDNMKLEPADYCMKIRGVEVGRGALRLGSFLCINPGNVREEMSGEKTKDPTFGLPALWIGAEQRDQAERAGYTVVDPPSIIATHLTEVIKRNAGDILGRQEVKSILDTVKKDYPAVVDDVQQVLGTGEVQKVLQGLLREQISVRNMVAILECLGDYGKVTKDIGFLTEKVRQSLARQICMQYIDDSRVIHVITLDPALEQEIIESRVDTAGGAVAALAPDIHRRYMTALTNTVRQVQEVGWLPVILCQEAARPLVKSSTIREMPDLVVLSVPEIINDVRVEGVGEIRIEP